MDLRKSLFILPNLFTVSSIFCGFNAIRVLSTAESPAVDPTRYQLAALLLGDRRFNAPALLARIR